MVASQTTETSGLTRLFDLELQYQPDAVQHSSAEGRPGNYLGSGTGVATADRLNGTVRWDLYEDQAPDRCETGFAGVITTDDGATISFDTRGWGYVPSKSEPNAWHMNAAVRFATDDPRYSRLDGLLAVWDGTFDAVTYQHRYTVYARSD